MVAWNALVSPRENSNRPASKPPLSTVKRRRAKAALVRLPRPSLKGDVLPRIIKERPRLLLLAAMAFAGMWSCAVAVAAVSDPVPIPSGAPPGVESFDVAFGAENHTTAPVSSAQTPPVGGPHAPPP